MSIFCEYGKVLWLLSILIWLVVWNKLWTRSKRSSFFFRYEYHALIGYIVVSFIVLLIASEHLC
jgi:hypothetical protein